MRRPVVKAVPALAVAVLIAGCGSRVAYSPPTDTRAETGAPTQSAAAEDEVTVDASYDRAWNAVVQTFFARNFPVETVEKESGLVRTGAIAGEIGVDCNCGSYLGVPIGGYGTYGGDAHYSFQVFVQRADAGRTSLTIRSQCRGSVDSVEGELTCKLEPKQEREVREAILARLEKTRRVE